MSLQRHEFKVIWLVSFSHFMTHSYMSILPAVLLAITAERGLSFTAIGLVTNIGYFLYGLGSFPAGYFSDRVGSKRVLTVGLGGMAISSILVGLSQGVLAFAVSYALLGLFASIHHPAGLSLIARRVENRRGKAMGLHGVLGNVGMMLAPLAAAMGLMFFRSWRAAYLFYGGLGLLSALICHRSRIEQEADLEWRSLFRWSELLKMRREAAAAATASGPRKVVFPLSLLLLFVVAVLSGFIFRGSLTFFPALLQREVYFISSSDQPSVLAGTVTSLILSLGLLGAWLGGWINDKIKRPELVPITIFVLIAPVLFMVAKFSDSKLLAASCLFSLIYYAWQPSHNYLITRYTRRASHGIGFGVNFFLLFGVGSVATAIGGYVADTYSVDRFYLVMAGVALAALTVATGVYLLRRWSLELPFKLVREEDPGR